MPNEDTQYGLKNYLQASSCSKTQPGVFKIKLEHRSGTELYLFLSFFSADIIRVHYSFDSEYKLDKPNSHLEFDSFDLSAVEIKTEENSNEFCFKTKTTVTKIYKNPLKLAIYNNAGEVLSEDVPGLGFWSAALEEPELGKNAELRCYKKYYDINKAPKIYGLGDKTGVINRWGRRFRNEPLDALGYDSASSDPLYKDIPFFINFNPEQKTAHGIFFDNFSHKFFDFGRERKPSLYYYFGAKSGELNYYFIAGPKIQDVVSNYLKLTGMPALMPDFTFGYLASGMSYTENYNQESKQDQSLENTLQRFQTRKIPASAFHLSSGYILNQAGERQQFSWNAEKFPEPKKFSENLNQLGVKLCANVKPVLLCSHPEYKQAQEQGVFIEDQDGQALVVDYWGGPGSYIDFSKAEAQKWWQDKLESQILDQGIYGIWNDNNEYEIFAKHQAQGREAEMSLIMSKLAYESANKKNPDSTPWILTRSGYAGIQKYAQTWTGDNYSSWQALQYDNAILSSLGISGLVHSGCDIGGFWGETPDAELLLRWIQNGVFTPRFCIHSYKQIPTEPDMYAESHPEFFKIIQDFFKLRSKLLPELQKANVKAHKQGVPIMRPTVYDFEHDEQTHEQSFEYMFCDKFLVAPVYKPVSESTTRKLYLPQIIQEANVWTHYFSGEKFSGGQFIELENSFEFIPVFVK